METVSYAAVAFTADSILFDGENPSVTRVREHLSPISPNDIYAHLDQWRRDQPPADLPEPTVPSEIPNELIDIVRQAMSRYAAMHAAELRDELDQAHSETMRLAMFGQFLEEDIQLLSDELEEAEDVSHQWLKAASDAEKRAETAEAELAWAQEHIQHLEDRLCGRISVH